MSSDSVLNEDTKSTSLLADVTDDSCIFKYIEIVPLTRDTDCPCTTERDSGYWSAQVKRENSSVVKQEPHDVRCIGFMWPQFINVCERNVQCIFDENYGVKCLFPVV